MKTKENTIVAFHIGRGGRYNNAGYLQFIGENKIGDFAEDLFGRYELQHNFSNRYGYEDTHDGQKCIIDLIQDYDFVELEDKFGITEEMLGEYTYYDGGGNTTDLTQSQVDSGIGTINIDYDFDTTYTKYLCDCSEKEIEAIKDSQYWNKEELINLIEHEITI
jgi:hypothetical protein